MSAWRSAPFRRLVGSTLATSVGTGMFTTATAWLALSAGGGAFGVGLVLAARMLPNLLLGLAAGTVADRLDRTRVLVSVGLAVQPAILTLIWLSTRASIEVWQLALLAFAAACSNVFDTPARQALVMDTVAPEVAPNAMALHAMVSRLSIALGAVVAGVLIPLAGLSAAYVAVALAIALGALLVLLVRPARVPREQHASGHLPSFRVAFGEAARLVVDVPAVRTLILAGVACEVFGFSFQTAVPVLARDVLSAGAEGLGTLNAATSLGGTISVALLSLVPGRVPREPVLAGVFVVYGVTFLALASARELPAAAAVLLVTGACAAAFDVLQQTLIQLAVPPEQRGRAVGVWVFGIGSAPFGHLEMGGLAAALGAPTALSINGCVMLLAATTLLVRAPGYRRILRAIH